MDRLLKNAIQQDRAQVSGRIFLLAVMIMPLFFQSAFAAETRKLTVIQETAPLFKEPSIRSSIIRYLEKGSELNLLAALDSFYLVSYGGYEGWVIPYSVEGDLGEQVSRDSITAYPEDTLDPDLASGRYLVVTNRYANIREGPGLSYKRIGRVYQGDKLEKFIKRGKWYRVRLPDSRIGFVREDLVADPTTQAVSPVAADQVMEQETAAESGNQRLTLSQKVDKLEREVVELRKLLNDHIRETRALLVEIQRSKSGPGSSGLLNRTPEGLDLGDPASIQLQSVKGKIIGNKATRIYHLPESIFYDKIPEELRVYFVTEDQARMAGYVKSIK